MPGKARVGKQRNSSSGKKRFKRTGGKRLAHEKVSHNHLLQQKSKKQKRLAKGRAIIQRGSLKNLKRALPSF